MLSCGWVGRARGLGEPVVREEESRSSWVCKAEAAKGAVGGTSAVWRDKRGRHARLVGSCGSTGREEVCGRAGRACRRRVGRGGVRDARWLGGAGRGRERCLGRGEIGPRFL